MFDIEKPNREKYAKLVASLRGKEKVRSIAWIPQRSELVVGTADGSVTFWKPSEGKSICKFNLNLDVLQSSPQEVTKIINHPDTKAVIVSNKGKTIKFWIPPKEWRSA